MNTSPFDYFISGVPAIALYDMSRNDLLLLINTITGPNQPSASSEGTKIELCVIGLVSYFESFCKNHFASAINVCPQLLINLINKNIDLEINLNDLFSVNFNPSYKIGSILSEKIDFGDAKKINFYYNSLFNFTPFSKNEILKYNELLNDRNLLIHHSGIFTTRYNNHKTMKKKIKGRIFLDSLVYTNDDFLNWDKFLRLIVLKILKQTSKSIALYVAHEKINLTKNKKLAIEYMKLGLDDKL